MQNWTKKRLFYFLLQWILLTYAAFLIYYRVIAVILQSIAGFLTQATVGLISAFILGVLMGLMQWLAMRKDLPKIALWIPATAIAWLLTIAVMQKFSNILIEIIDFLKLYWMEEPTPFLRGLLRVLYGPTYFSDLNVFIGLSLILGLFLGLAQFAILKPHIRSAALWIPLNIAAGYLTYRLAFTLTESPIQLFLFFPIHALLTGLAMCFLLWKYKK